MDGVDEKGVATAEGEALAHQLVVFSLAEEEYGIPITLVQEIIRYSAPRPIPGSPFHVEGVINLRGRIIPVVDLRARLAWAASVPRRPRSSSSRWRRWSSASSWTRSARC